MRLIDADQLLDFIRFDERVIAPEEHTAQDIVMMIQTAPTSAPPPNDPLTLEELRELGEDWVWIKFLMPAYGMETGYYIKKPQFSDADKFCCGYPAPNLVTGELKYAGYGIYWLAYRRRPEENCPPRPPGKSTCCGGLGGWNEKRILCMCGQCSRPLCR